MAIYHKIYPAYSTIAKLACAEDPQVINQAKSAGRVKLKCQMLMCVHYYRVEYIASATLHDMLTHPGGHTAGARNIQGTGCTPYHIIFMCAVFLIFLFIVISRM